jgi:3-hydroxyisobutyrate dehydrogenase-like beta-hydroxyacid dehydrogenase
MEDAYMDIKTIALLHPGNMGATIGAAASTSGARVLWASSQRSAATCARAKQAGLIDAETLAEAVHESEVVLSVCPPHAAVDLARIVAATNFKGIYVDANAISRRRKKSAKSSPHRARALSTAASSAPR